METNFNRDVYEFIKACNLHKVKMILVGGSAVNYYGYKRHSADIDFWVDNSSGNLANLLKALHSIGYEFEKFPPDVLKGNQNISLKFSPDLELELITRFNPGKTFEQAYNDSLEYITKGQQYMKWNIISLEDLINSKIKSGRPKDLLDVYELKRVQQS